MGYFAQGNGFITLKEGSTLPEEIMDSIYDYFECADFMENTLDLSAAYEKYDEDSLYDILISLTPFINSGELEYTGEDDYHWKIVFDGSRWIEYSGKIIYEDEERSHIISEENQAELLGQFIDAVEDFLEEKHVFIHNPERYESDEDNPAIIYGSDYDTLSTSFKSILKRWGLVKHDYGYSSSCEHNWNHP